MSYSLQDIQQVVDYFGPVHVYINGEFTNEKGWVRISYKKRPSRSYLRKLKAQGVTHVALTDGQRIADFTVQELLRRDRAPLLGGKLI